MSSNGEDECSVFVKVAADDGTDDIMELPTEEGEGLLMSTLQGQFPGAVGLKYKGSSGAWRAVRIADDTLNPPSGGWGDTTYNVTMNKGTLKRKADDETAEEPVAKSKKEDDKSTAASESDKTLLGDLAVFQLSYNCTDEDLKEYFTENCGELAYCEVKKNRATKKPKGFGFIRFKTVEGAKKALEGEHIIKGREAVIKVSKKKENPFKLFVGRIPEGTSSEDLKEYFGAFGEVRDAYIPPPFRGFGFVVFLYAQEGRLALKKNHEIKGARLNVQFAEPAEEKEARRRMEADRGRGDVRGNGYDSRDAFRRGPVDDYPRDMRDSRGMRDSRDIRDSRDMRDSYGPRRDSRDARNPRKSLEGMRGSRDRYPANEPIRDSRYGSRDEPPLDNRNIQSELKNMLVSLLAGNSY